MKNKLTQNLSAFLFKLGLVLIVLLSVKLTFAARVHPSITVDTETIGVNKNFVQAVDLEPKVTTPKGQKTKCQKLATQDINNNSDCAETVIQ